MGPDRANGAGMILGTIAQQSMILTRIVLGAVYSGGPSYGGFSKLPGDEFGTISPTGASAVPGAAPSIGAAGEILKLVYEFYEGATHRVEVRIAGNYSTPPFSSLLVDGSTTLSSPQVITHDSTSSLIRFLPASNPIPAGNHTLKFS